VGLWNGVLIEWSGGLFTTSHLLENHLSELIYNIRYGLNEAGIEAKMVKNHSKLFIETTEIEKTLSIIQRIFGVAHATPCIRTRLSKIYDAISSVSEEFTKQGFFPIIKFIDSKGLSVKEAAQVFNLKDLSQSRGEFTKTIDVNVEVVEDSCYVYTGHLAVAGPGGLPIGAMGRVVCLVSGGIDSPVATWMMMRRGCPITILFAYFPMGGDESDLKRFINVIKRLHKWHIGREMQVYTYRHDQNLVAFRKVALKFTCILCRRMMYRVANALASIVGAKAIVTGENLAQVASQTLQNLNVINQASELPVLRPLIGFDKEEIIEIAKRIGTYEASCMRVSSGCASIRGCWARPPKPATHAPLNTIIEAESNLNIKELLERSVSSLKRIPNELFIKSF
jgi:thiamine biosynthesis protein ThiI